MIEQPGPVFDTLGVSNDDSGDAVPLIDIPSETTYDTTGALDLLTVSIVGSPGNTPRLLDLALAWFDPSKSIRRSSRVYPAGVSSTDRSEREPHPDGELAAGGHRRRADRARLRRPEHDHRAGDQRRQLRGRASSRRTIRSSASMASASPNLSELRDAARTSTAPTAPPRSASCAMATRLDRAGHAVRQQRRHVLGCRRAHRLHVPVRRQHRPRRRRRPVRRDDVRARHHRQAHARSADRRRERRRHRHDRRRRRVGRDRRHPAEALRRADAGATLFLAPESNCDEVVGHIPSGLRWYAVGTLSGLPRGRWIRSRAADASRTSHMHRRVGSAP